jgi:hypothetical protein
MYQQVPFVGLSLDERATQFLRALPSSALTPAEMFNQSLKVEPRET